MSARREPPEVQARKLQRLQEIDGDLLGRIGHAPQVEAAIRNHELAARMQVSASDALDLNQESKETLERYGIGQKETDSYGRQCLLARRMVERGVRFIQLYSGAGSKWDSHSKLGV